ncbi:MAG: leucyl aminopeptidase [Spirochaetia bacterium]|nr:leucyl aminopeptidase [Spirochaetia bacterium]
MPFEDIKIRYEYKFKNQKVKDKEDVIYLIPVFFKQEPLSILKLIKKSDIVPLIKDNYRMESFQGKFNEKLSLLSQGVILGGLGKEQYFHPERLMTLMRSFAQTVSGLEKASINLVFNQEVKEAVEKFNKLSENNTEAFLIVDENSEGQNQSDEEEEILPEYLTPYTYEEAVSQSISSFIVGSSRMELLKTEKTTSRKKTAKKTDIRNAGIIASHLSGTQLKHAVDRGQSIGQFVNSTRSIVSLPGNHFHPEEFEKYAKTIAKDHSLKIKIFNEAKLKSMGFGGILSVGKGSEIPPRMIVLEYRPQIKKELMKVALVGKGITFDTGGISLKPPSEMHEMKYDMCGAATVLHAIALASERKLPIEITALLGIAENMPGSRAVKPGDVYTAYNGKTVEIQNTDAEGRLVLGDVLSYACDTYKPDYLLDFATLTGSVVVALGHEATGVMTSSERLAGKIEAASRKSLDRSWRLPHWSYYGKGLKSNIADLRNIAGREGGTISAMRFLSAFVKPGIPWAHFDIAGTAWRKKGSGSQSGGATGWGIRFLNQFFEDLITKE